MNLKLTDQKWIEEVTINEKDFLRFTFTGKLTHVQAAQVCADWREISLRNKAKKYNIIFNSLDMNDYEPLARTVFQKTIKELSSQITKIWVVTNSRLISGGAAIMGAFTSFAIKSVSSEDQIVSV